MMRGEDDEDCEELDNDTEPTNEELQEIENDN